jgi:cobalt-zinc-cadmium efflux system protein
VSPHTHSHHHHGHVHFDAAAAADTNRTRLYVALALIVALMAGELAVGGGPPTHARATPPRPQLTDAAAIALALLALRLAARPAGGMLTFGLRRVEILSAQANGVTLVVLAAFVTYEAVHRLVDPPHVRAGLVLALALAGAVVNLAASAILAGADRRSLNIEGSYQHILTDLFGFLGTAVAAGVILATGFRRADPIVSLLIAGLMVRSGTSLLLASGRVFLEAAPEGLDPEAVGQALVAEPGVIEVHDLHVWEVTSGFPALSAHVLVGSDSDCHAARRAMEAMLHERFGLDHTTLQVDHEGGDLLSIAPIGAGGDQA